MNTSRLTKEALAKLKAKGVKLGNPNPGEALKKAIARRRELAASHNAAIRPIIEEIKSCGIVSLAGIADALNKRGHRTRRGSKFHPTTVRRIIIQSDHSVRRK